MIIDNNDVLNFFEKHIYKHYVDFGDLKAIQKSEDYDRKYFSESYDTFLNNEYFVYTEYEDDILIEIVASQNCCLNEQIFDEVIEYGRKSNKTILLLAEEGIVKLLPGNYTVTEKQGTGFEHFGIYGCSNCLTTCGLLENSLEIAKMSEDDREQISKLSTEHFGNLPIIVRFIKDIDKIFLAKLNNQIVGYLSYTSSHEPYYDIAIIMVHPSYRSRGIGKALIQHLASNVSDKIYYGSAKSIESSILAERLGFEKIINAKKVYSFLGELK